MPIYPMSLFAVGNTAYSSDFIRIRNIQQVTIGRDVEGDEYIVTLEDEEYCVEAVLTTC